MQIKFVLKYIRSYCKLFEKSETLKKTTLRDRRLDQSFGVIMMIVMVYVLVNMSTA